MSDYEEMRNVARTLTEPRKVVVERSARTGVPSLDLALGGGLPVGATEIFGGPGVGKSSLAYEILGAAQADGFVAAISASEYLDVPRMVVHNAQLDDLVIIKGKGTEVLEGSLEFLKDCRLAGVRCVLAIDSASALRPSLEGRGNAPAMLELFCVGALAALPPHSSIVMVNQVRQLRSIEQEKFLNEIDSTSRKMVEMFNARLKLSRSGVTETTYDMVVDVLANEGGPPSCILKIPFDKKRGIDSMLDLVRCGVSCGAIVKSGSWFHLHDGSEFKIGEILSLNLGEGERRAAETLSRNPETAEKVLNRVMHGWL